MPYDTAFPIIAGSAAASLLVLQYVSSFLAWQRGRIAAGPSGSDRDENLPPISLIRPLCGMENFSGDTLISSFHLDYPSYELIFCVANEADPIIPWVRSAMETHAHIESRLIIGDVKISGNPKLNNMVRGWEAARYDHIAFIDSNVLLVPHFLRNLVEHLKSDTGVVSAPPIGCKPRGFFANLECAFLNTYEARWQYASEAVGNGFAQGKTLFFPRFVLEQGFNDLASEPAEDAAATKLVRRLGLKARLAPPSLQPLGPRKARDVWMRQLRWARLRRMTFPLEFAPEILTGIVIPLLFALIAAYGFGLSLAAVLIGFSLLWYLPEVLLARLCGWPSSLLMLPASLLRDLLIPLLWIGAWIGNGYRWRGPEIEGVSQNPAATRAAAKLAATKLAATKLSWQRVRTSFGRAFPR